VKQIYLDIFWCVGSLTEGSRENYLLPFIFGESVAFLRETEPGVWIGSEYSIGMVISEIIFGIHKMISMNM
jgi:hypothetical protein